MRYMQYQPCDTVNGSGIRCSLWVSGCTINCKGCFSPKSHKFENGKLYDADFEQMILQDIAKPHISGLSILGGHMFERQNFETCLELVKKVKSIPGKNVYAWTGHVLSKIQQDSQYAEALDYVDVLIDGPFVESLSSKSLYLCGSSNQRILYRNADF